MVARLVLNNTDVEWFAQRIEISVVERQPSLCRGMLSPFGDISCEVTCFKLKDAYN